MSFATEGYPVMIGAVALSAIVFLLALRLRSWPLWLGGLLCAVIAVAMAWQYRVPLPSA